MKKSRRLLSLFLSAAMIMVNMTGTFAYDGGDGAVTGYDHVAIAIGLENGDYYLAEKPQIKADGKEITLGKAQNSQNNGREYQSGMNCHFTTDTVFTVKAVITKDGIEKINVEFTITDIANYKNTGMSFYEYCRTKNCDGKPKSGIDMKLTYEEILENFYNVKYDVDGDLTVITDTTGYKPGDTVTITSELPSKDGHKFIGWQYGSNIFKAGDTIEMPEGSITFVAKWIKQYTVTYKVDGKVVNTYVVDEGTDISNFGDYIYDISDEGKSFSGWTVESGNVSNVTSDVVITGTTSIKKFTVTFLDENGNVISEATYKYSEPARIADAPAKADYKFIDDTGAARWFRYSFAGWSAEGEYTLDDLNSVKQNMIFKASYRENEVKTMFYVLNRGLAQPIECRSYPNVNYSRGVEGTIREFVRIVNNDEKVAANIVSAPSSEQFRLYDGGELELKDGEYIKWYVIKEESDGWHVDGIIVEKKYTVTVRYVDDDTNEEIADSRTETVGATETYKIASPTVTGYELSDDKEAVVEGIMPDKDVTVVVKYIKVGPETTTSSETTVAETTAEKTTTVHETETPKEEDVDLSVPYVAPETSDSSKYVFYIVLFLGVVVGGTAVATKKKEENLI